MSMLELFSYTFFQHALLGSVLASILCGLVGTYIVTRRLVFISGGIAHASLGGVGLGALCGFSPVLGAAGFSVLSGLGIQWLCGRREVREDSAVAMLWTFGMSVGLLCSFLSPSFMPDLPGYLFGNILTITQGDLLLLAVLTAIAVGVFGFFLPAIVSVAFDSEFARSQGLPVRLIEYLMMILIALTIVACLRMVGIILVVSLLSIPQMTANLFTQDYKRLLLLSVVFAVAGCWGGLACSCWLNVPGGASVILVSIVIYLLAKTIKTLFGG